MVLYDLFQDSAFFGFICSFMSLRISFGRNSGGSGSPELRDDSANEFVAGFG